MGTPNAAVFPVPVLAWPTTFFPSIIGGMAFSWMGNISVKPISLSAFFISCLISSSSKFISISGMYRNCLLS